MTRRSASRSLAESLRLQHSVGLLSALAVDETSSQESSMLRLTLTEASDADVAARRGVLEGTAFCRPRSGTTFLLLASELVTNAVRHARVRPEDQCRFMPLGLFGARAVTGHAAFEEVTRR